MYEVVEGGTFELFFVILSNFEKAELSLERALLSEQF